MRGLYPLMFPDHSNLREGDVHTEILSSAQCTVRLVGSKSPKALLRASMYHTSILVSFPFPFPLPKIILCSMSLHECFYRQRLVMRKNQEVIDTQEKAVQDARRVHRYRITTSNVYFTN